MVKKRPSHRRVRLGLAIHEARRSKQWSQAELARRARTTQPVVSRLESADIIEITMPSLDRIIAALQIGEVQAGELRSFAESPYDARGLWFESPDTMGWWQQHLEIERHAKEICAVSLNAHDGLLQSEPYMRRQFELARTPNREARVQARLARQDAVLRQAEPPECTFILHEACLRVDMGGPAVLREQLRHLLTVSHLPHVNVLIVPFDAALPALAFAFTLLKFGSTVMGDFVAVEYGVGGTTLDDEDSLNHFQNRWDRLLAGTVSHGASRDRIGDALARIDRE